MNITHVLQRLDEERRTLAHFGETLEVLPHITRLTVGGRFMINFACLPSQRADALIDEQVEYHRSLGHPFEWKVYRHDAPADLLDRLAKRGFSIGDHEAVMVLNLAERPRWIDETDLSFVHRVDTLDDLLVYKSAAEAIFGKEYSATTTELAEALRAGSSDHRAYITIRNGKAISIARLHTHRDSHFGGLYGGGTREEFRGRGFYRTLIAARARDAAALGARYLIVDALPTSRPILERLGFVHVSDTWPCEWIPAARTS